MTAPQLGPGQLVSGKYSIRALLGYGGATATYAAATAQGREVVVRLLSLTLGARGDVLGALQQAGVYANSLPAESTTPILESGFDQQTGAAFAVTEMVTIPSLAQAAQSGPLAVADVVAVLQGIARAVDPGRAQGLAHGGLKPNNVFIGAGPQRAIKVVDFGIAVVRAALPTPEGATGSAPWLSPEQLQGGPATPASDVFSAGLVAFFAATGKPYWRSCQGPQPDLGGLQQEMGAPRMPASVRAQELGASLSQGFDAILARALAQNPAERFGSVGELAEAVLKSGGPQKMAMTMPLNAMPMAAQEMLRKATAAAAQPASGGPMGGGDTLAIQSPVQASLEATQWAPQQQPPPRQSQQPPTQPVPVQYDMQAPLQQQMQMQPPMQQAPMMQQQPGMPILTPLGGFQPPVMNQGPQGVRAQPSYGPPPESSVVVPKSKGGLIIVLVLLAVVLIGGSITAVVLLRHPKDTSGETATTTTTTATATAPSATASAAATAPPAASTAAAATAEPSATATTSAAAPTDSAAAAPPTADAGAAAAEPAQAVVTIVCTPECDSIKIDDKQLDNDADASTFPASEPVNLSPGPHTIVVGRATFLPQTKKIVLKTAQNQKVAFFLTKPGAAAPATTKQCGKFLERCP